MTLTSLSRSESNYFLCFGVLQTWWFRKSCNQLRFLVPQLVWAWTKFFQHPQISWLPGWDLVKQDQLEGGRLHLGLPRGSCCGEGHTIELASSSLGPRHGWCSDWFCFILLCLFKVFTCRSIRCRQKPHTLPSYPLDQVGIDFDPFLSAKDWI